MSDFAIELQGISKYYKLYDAPQDRLKEALHPFGKKYHHDFYALKELDLKIRKGEILGVVGKNGSGKSTLLKIISGVLKPSSGTVTVRGKISALLELGAGFNPEFTGMQNIFFYGIILGMSKKEVEDKLDDIISFADIGEFINQPLKTYSSGMKARLGFALAVNIEPDILLVDEVLSVGDLSFQKKSYQKMENLINGGATVIFVSHAEESIKRLCSRAILLQDHKILVDGKPTNVIKVYNKHTVSTINIDDPALKEEFNKLENNSDSRVDDLSIQIQDDSYFSEVVHRQSKPVEIKNLPVELLSIEIKNDAGNKINILEHGLYYMVELQYKFFTAITNVVFPLSFSTIKGECLYGIRHPHCGADIGDVNSGDVVSVVYRIKFDLLAGNYFLSCGVTTIRTGGIEIVLRVADAASFRICETKEKVHWGKIALNIESTSHNFVASHPRRDG